MAGLPSNAAIAHLNQITAEREMRDARMLDTSFHLYRFIFIQATFSAMVGRSVISRHLAG